MAKDYGITKELVQKGMNVANGSYKYRENIERRNNRVAQIRVRMGRRLGRSLD